MHRLREKLVAGLQWRPSQPDRRWQRLALTVLICLSAAIFGGLLWRSWPMLSTYSWRLNALGFGVIALAYSLDLLTAVYSWREIMRRLSVDIPFSRHLFIYGSTLVAGRLPGLPWHIAGRLVLYERQGVAKRITGLAAGMEVVLITLSGFLLGLALLPVLLNPLRVGALFFVFGGIVGCVLLLHPTVLRRILKWLKRDISFTMHYRETALLVGLYAIVWLLGGGVLYGTIMLFYPLAISDIPKMVCSWGMAGAISNLAFFSPTGLGIREITLAYFLSTFMPPGIAVVSSITFRLVLTAAELLTSVITTHFGA